MQWFVNVPRSGWVGYGVDLNLKVEMAFRNRDVNPVSFEDANVSLVIFPLRLFQLDKKRNIQSLLYRGQAPPATPPPNPMNIPIHQTPGISPRPPPAAKWTFLDDFNQQILYDAWSSQSLEEAFRNDTAKHPTHILKSSRAGKEYRIFFEASLQINWRTGRRREIFRNGNPCMGPAVTAQARLALEPHWSFKSEGEGYEKFLPVNSALIAAAYGRGDRSIYLRPQRADQPHRVVNFSLCMLIDILEGYCCELKLNGLPPPERDFNKIIRAKPTNMSLIYQAAADGKIGDLYLLLADVPHEGAAKLLNSMVKNETALHAAARGNHIECALLLVKHGANTKCMDKEGLMAQFHVDTLLKKSTSPVAAMLDQAIKYWGDLDGTGLYSCGFKNKMAACATKTPKLPPVAGVMDPTNPLRPLDKCVDFLHQRVKARKLGNDIELKSYQKYQIAVKESLDFAAEYMAKGMNKLKNPLTVQEIAAIYIYSLEQVEFYRPLNAALLEHSRELVKVYFPFIRLMCTGIDKIPCYSKASGKTYVYRGMAASDEILKMYHPGKIFQWWNFSSTSKARKIALRFAIKGAQTKGALGGVIFRIECDVGMSIKEFSKFPKEDEVLLKPGLTYRVMKVTDNKSEKSFFQKIFNKQAGDHCKEKIWVIDIKHDISHKCFLQTQVS